MVPMATLWHVYKIKVPDDSIESLNLTYVSALHSASYGDYPTCAVLFGQTLVQQ